MRISWLSLRQGRYVLLGALLLCLGSGALAARYEDGVHLLLFALGFLALVAYWHVTQYYVSVNHNQLVLENELRQVTRPREQVWQVVSISGPVYQLVLRDRTAYLFLVTPLFPLHRGFRRNETRAADLLHQLIGQGG